MEAERLQRKIAANDGAIDKLVYELYGLTEEEVRLVERKRFKAEGEGRKGENACKSLALFTFHG